MICPIHGNDIVPNCNFCIGRETGEITIDRLRIVRNSIVRKWQRAKEVCEELPENAASKEHLQREMGGLMAALEELYGEFDELERMALDQKPRCPFCQEEMEHPALADHMKEHMEAGDMLPPEVRGIKPSCLWMCNAPMFHDEKMREEYGIPSIGPARGPGVPLHPEDKFTIQFVDDSLIEVIIHGIKYKTSYLRELMAEAVRDFHGKKVLFSSRFLEAAGGTGGAAHPEPEPEKETP